MVTLLDKSVSRQRQAWGYTQTSAHTDKPRQEEQRWNKVGKKRNRKRQGEPCIEECEIQGNTVKSFSNPQPSDRLLVSATL